MSPIRKAALVDAWSSDCRTLAIPRGAEPRRDRARARHWAVFAGLCRSAEVRGQLVPDAYLAAMAIERGALMCTTDRGFARFNDLRWRHPFDDPIDVGPRAEEAAQPDDG